MKTSSILIACLTAAIISTTHLHAVNPIGINFNGDAQDANGNYGLYPNGLTNLNPTDFVFGQAGWNNLFNTGDGETTNITDSLGALKGWVAISSDSGGGRLAGTRYDGTPGSAFAEPLANQLERILYNGLNYNMNHGVITVSLSGASPSYEMVIYGSGGNITVHDNTNNTDYTTVGSLGALATPGFSSLTLPATTGDTTYSFGDHGNFDYAPAYQANNSPLISGFQFKPLAPPSAYWTGDANPLSPLWTNSANFATDLAGLVPSTGALTATTDVVFNATTSANFASTTLGAHQSIKTLKINATSPLEIGGIYNLTITPGTPATGITITTGPAGPLTHTISCRVLLGADQTWTVTDADRTLVVSDEVAGNFDLTKAGDGVLNLDGTQSYDSLTATAGTTNVNGTLGTIPANGTASVTVATGAQLHFGQVSQSLQSLTIDAAGTVTFSSGIASGAFTGGGQKLALANPVPEPGCLALLALVSLTTLTHRRRPLQS